MAANKFKNTVSNIKEMRYNYLHRKQAEIALKSIKEDTGYQLSKKMKSNIDEYSKEIFGSRAYAPWLYVYSAFNQEFKEGWIPDNYFGLIVAPIVNKNLGKVASIKTLSKKILRSDLLPDLCYLIDGRFYDLNYNILSNKEAKELLFTNNKEIFLKKDASDKGKGVFKLTDKTFDSLDLNLIGDAVLQESINQMDWFDEIISDNVATIRVITVFHKGQAKTKASFLRTGRKGSHLIKASESIKIPIINENGALHDIATGPQWESYTLHPDTGYNFSNKVIPNYNYVVDACEKLHQNFPHYTIIAWDAIISNAGDVKIMEWNAFHPGVKFTEPALGPSFQEYNWESLWKTNL